MRQKRSRQQRRSAFTLVELLVVLLIIAILVSLVSSAAMKALGKIPEVRTATEISQLAVALEAFKNDFGLTDPPPSQLVLSETAPLTTVSGPFLLSVFGKNLGSSGWVDWNGDGIPNGPWTLEGEQSLVFCLGGIPSQAGGPQGFSTNNSNPSTLGGKRKGPYIPFDLTRLKPTVGGFFVLVDPWQSKTSPFYATLGGSPYAYFSPRGYRTPTGTPKYGYVSTDCSGINAAPYFIAGTTQFMSPNGYQIISAGRDGVFGTVGWVPAAGATGTGADDQATFSGGLLGNGQQ